MFNKIAVMLCVRISLCFFLLSLSISSLSVFIGKMFFFVLFLSLVRLLLLAIGSELHFYLLLWRAKVNSLVAVLFRLRYKKHFIPFSSTILIGSQSHLLVYRSTHFSSMNAFGSLHFLLLALFFWHWKSDIIF